MCSLDWLSCNALQLYSTKSLRRATVRDSNAVIGSSEMADISRLLVEIVDQSHY